MMVEPEFSRLAGFTPQDNQPIIDTRKATTTLRVANRQTLVLSGLRQRSDTGEFNGVPFLKDIKYVGPLFRSRDTNVRESELIVFIMPEIVAHDEQATCRQYQALETIDCRLNAVPAAEGCPPGCQPCADGYAALNELPPVGEDGGLPSEGGEPGPAVAPPAAPGATAPASPMRPAYEARYRASNGSDFQRQFAPTKTPNEKPVAKKSTWQRLFGS
jgi:general secretion pathway protein D